MSDLSQLSALCEQMDATAFLPLQSEELTGSIGRRTRQFYDLVDDLAALLVAKGIADTRGLRPSGAYGLYGRYMRLKGHAAFLVLNFRSWERWGASPIWLRLGGADWKRSSAVEAFLSKARIDFKTNEHGAHIPVYLKTGVERPAVITDALRQIEIVAAALPFEPMQPTVVPVE